MGADCQKCVQNVSTGTLVVPREIQGSRGKGINCRIISRGGQCVSNAGDMMDLKEGSELQGNGGGGQCISNGGKLAIREETV